MTDELELLRQARPPAAGPDPALAHRARGELMAGIAMGRPTWHRRRAALAAPALAAAAVAMAALLLVDRGGDRAWAAPLVRVAQAAPRLLVGEPGWTVTRADELGGESGEMTFSNGHLSVDLRWQPASGSTALVKDRGSATTEVARAAPVEGGAARVFRYDGPANDFTALWVRGNHVLELRGVAASSAEFVALLASLRGVGVDEWLSAMPASVVKPGAHDAAVEQMLAGIPRPQGFDATPLLRGSAVRDRYQLGAQVTGAVACAWIRQWLTGGEAARREAVAALAGSRSWPILREMTAQGDYPKVLWQYADAVASGSPVMGGKPLTVEQSYRQALGC